MAGGPRSFDELLERRIIIVTGKGGTGKTTIAAALAMRAARGGRQVLAIDVDAGGDLARALGGGSVGFAPQIVQPNLSVLALHREESFQEYLRLYFRVPRLTRLTPLARILDFIATGVPGPRDMLVVGKIVHEERRRDPSGQRRWDVVVVDGAATGHALPQLRAAQDMARLVRGGVIREQVEWIDESLTDGAVTGVVLCATPEEMPVVEALQMHDALRRETVAALALGVVNRMPPAPLTPTQRRAVDDRLDARDPGASPLREGLEFADVASRRAQRHARTFRSGLSVSVIDVPLVSAPPGLGTTRAVEAAMGRS